MSRYRAQTMQYGVTWFTAEFNDAAAKTTGMEHNLTTHRPQRSSFLHHFSKKKRYIVQINTISSVLCDINYSSFLHSAHINTIESYY